MIGALAIVLGLASVVSHALEYRGPERFSKDFALDYTSALALREGKNPYAPIRELIGRYLNPPPDVLERSVLPGGNWHPPFKVAATVPFTFLPYQAAGVVWLLLTAATLAIAVALFATALGVPSGTAFVAGTGALALPVAQIDLSAGQLNGPLLLLLVLAWRALRRGSDVAAGAALGVAASLKFFPGFLAVSLLGMRRMRSVAAAALTFIVLTVVGLIPGGISSASGQFGALGSEGLGYWETSPANLAWWGFSTRWLSSNVWVGGADLDGLATAVAVVGVLVLAGLAVRPPGRLTGDPFWSAVPIMLLAWPIVWSHYLMLAIPWVVLSLRTAFSQRRERDELPLMMAVTSVVGLLLMLGFPPGLDTIDRASDLQVALGYQLPTAALLAAVLMDRFATSEGVAGAATATSSGPGRG